MKHMQTKNSQKSLQNHEARSERGTGLGIYDHFVNYEFKRATQIRHSNWQLSTKGARKDSAPDSRATGTGGFSNSNETK